MMLTNSYFSSAGQYHWVAGKLPFLAYLTKNGAANRRHTGIQLVHTQKLKPYLSHKLTMMPVSRGEHAAVLSWFTAWFNVAGWVCIDLEPRAAYNLELTIYSQVCLSATASLFGSSLIMSLALIGNSVLVPFPFPLLMKSQRNVAC